MGSTKSEIFCAVEAAVARMATLELTAKEAASSISNLVRVLRNPSDSDMRRAQVAIDTLAFMNRSLVQARAIQQRILGSADIEAINADSRRILALEQELDQTWARLRVMSA